MNSFEPKSIDIVNIAPAFRGHYDSFSPNSPFPILPCKLGASLMMVEDKKNESLGKMKQVKQLDMCTEGLQVESLSRLMSTEAVSYTAGLEDWYAKMLAKIETLTSLVEKSSAKVIEQMKKFVVSAPNESNTVPPLEGLLFRPFEEFKKEDVDIPKDPQLSFGRQYNTK